MLIRYIYIRIKHIPSLNQFYIINLINELLPQWLHQLICNQFQLLLKKKGLLFLFQKKKKKKKNHKNKYIFPLFASTEAAISACSIILKQYFNTLSLNSSLIIPKTLDSPLSFFFFFFFFLMLIEQNDSKFGEKKGTISRRKIIC